MGDKKNKVRRKKRAGFHGTRPNASTAKQDGGPHEQTQAQEGMTNSNRKRGFSTPTAPVLNKESPSCSMSASRRKILGHKSVELAPDTPTRPRGIDSTEDRPSTSCDAVGPVKDTHKDENFTGFALIHADVFQNVVNQLLCPTCQSAGLKILTDKRGKCGFALFLRVVCLECGHEAPFCTSPKVQSEGRGGKPYEVNRRMVMAFRAIGKGLEAMKSFTLHMNMPEPMTSKNYNAFLTPLRNACISEAEDSMGKAAKSLREEDPECPVSVDGTWQRRGHSSLNGVVTAISTKTGKCLDYSIKTKKCKACEVWSKKDKNSQEYQDWSANHVCSMDHQGSAGAMEPSGAVEIFCRSEEKHQLQYTEYIGDGDSAAYKKVVDSNPYPGKTIVKKECVGHIQKRVGSRLRKKRQDYRGKKLADGKPIGGSKGRLTDSAMNRLQNYFGIAIRQNKGNLADMKKAAIAALYHCASSEDHPQHEHCSESWCGYVKDRDNYKHKGHGLDKAVFDVILPVFQDLANDELLSRCLDAYTQNPNESLNGKIWSYAPKQVYCGRNILEIATATAVCHFNDGLGYVTNILKRLGIEAGIHTTSQIGIGNRKRIGKADKASSEPQKKRRKTLRAIKKGYQDKERKEEGELYASGQH